MRRSRRVELGISKGLKRRVSLTQAEEARAESVRQFALGIQPVWVVGQAEVSDTVSSTPRALHT